MPLATLSWDRAVILPHPTLRRETDALGFLPEETITLRSFYERVILPELIAESSRGSLKEDRIALGHWERETGDPDIRTASKEHVLLLRDGLLGRGRMRRATINKTWRELVMMLGWACDEGVIARVPYLSRKHKTRLVKEPPKRQRQTLTFDEVERLWRACARASYPRVRGCHAPLLWRTALVLFYAYGARTRDVFRLQWSDVLFSDGVVRLEALKTSKLQGLPLLPFVERWLRTVWHGGGKQGDVLPGFKTKGFQWRTGPRARRWKRGYYTTWRSEICRAAGIDDVWIKHFRESMVTRYNRRHKGLGSWIAGHYVPGVSAQNYDLPTDEIREAMTACEYPPCFDEPV